MPTKKVTKVTLNLLYDRVNNYTTQSRNDIFRVDPSMFSSRYTLRNTVCWGRVGGGLQKKNLDDQLNKLQFYFVNVT